MTTPKTAEEIVNQALLHVCQSEGCGFDKQWLIDQILSFAAQEREDILTILSQRLQTNYKGIDGNHYWIFSDDPIKAIRERNQ